MPIYQYEAKLSNGELRKGKMEAVDENAVRAMLRSMEYYPMDIRVAGKSDIDFSKFTKVKLRDISVFCRQFSYILVAGLNIVKALELLKEETQNKRLRKSITNLYEKVQKGKGLSSSMEDDEVFPEMLVNMVAVGEASGKLDDIMIRMADYYDKEYEQQQKVKQAMTYPVIVCIFAIIIVNFLVISVLPKMIGSMFDDKSKLPLPTQIVIGISNFMRAYWFIILGLIILAAILFKVFSKGKNSADLDKIKLKLPVFGKLILKVATAKFGRTVGMLLYSGLPVLDCILISARVVGNSFLEKMLNESCEDIKRGTSISDSIESKKIFSPMFIQMIRIGEESGTLDEVLSKTAAFYDKEAETATAQMTIMIEPLIIIVLAAVVGFIILSIILPMFQMYDSVGN